MMIEKISNWINKNIGLDGLMHFSFCVVLTTIMNLILPIFIVAPFVLIIALGKEVYDKKSKTGSAELKDIICDLTGILIGVL